MNNLYAKKSLLGNKWEIQSCDERKSLMISQRHNISLLVSKLLTIRKIEDEDIENFLNPDIYSNLPNPFILKDMEKSAVKLADIIIHKKK